MNSTYDMFPPAEADAQTLKYWVADLCKSSQVSAVLKTEAFRRLNDIAFLGAIDYSCLSHSFDKKKRSRAHHSLHVAALANYVASRRGYDAALKQHLILAALLHDIGHLPLSHSAEPYFKTSWGISHHRLGKQILQGEERIGKTLNKVLKKHANIEFLITLMDGKAAASEGGDLFSHPINVDTIDGILRTCEVMAVGQPSVSRLKVAKAAFVDAGHARYSVLDKFWALKNFVYEQIINNKINALADYNARQYFEERKLHINTEDLFTTDTHWQSVHRLLFDRVKTNYRDSIQSLNITKRAYQIDVGASGLQRYRTEKWPSNLRLRPLLRNPESEQYTFFF